MRILRSHVPFATACLLAAGTFGTLPAQEPTPPATPPEATKPAAPAAAPTPTPPAEGQGRRPRRQAMVLQAGTVHPVSGPAIENGVVVIRGERIVAVGKQGEVEVPENATVRSFPTGHLYPGLVDASTDAFTDAGLRGDGSLDGGAQLALDLHLRGDRDDELAAAGITTAYVTVRSPATMRGQGAIVRPKAGGFEVWTGRENAGLQLRMTNGPGPTHALQRQQQLDGYASTFDGLEEYRKARTDHEEALKKYQKEFDEYLAFHQKKKDAEKPKDGDKPKEGDKPAAAPAPAAPAEGAPAGERRRGPGGRRGEGGGGGGGGNEPPKPNGGGEELEAALTQLIAVLAQDPPKQDPPKQEPKPAGAPPAQGGAPAAPAGENPAEKKDEGPKRPTYPKAPAKDPQKDALLRVLDGELPLRIEAHRQDELRSALQLQQKNTIPLVVLEQAYGAAPVIAAIAAQGASVVLTEVLPNSMPEQYRDFEVTALPAQLQAAGVPFAIASGSARRASLLPLMAASAVGAGLDRDAALRAITLSAAEILGVAKDTGSLQQGKFGDVLVTDRPLFQSDCRVLFVASKGHPEFEAK